MVADRTAFPDIAVYMPVDLPSLQEYLLIGSEEKEIIVYRRENDWRPYHYNEGDSVELASLGVSFPFDAVYRRIRLA